MNFAPVEVVKSIKNAVENKVILLCSILYSCFLKSGLMNAIRSRQYLLDGFAKLFH